jgi:hypothetical protein
LSWGQHPSLVLRNSLAVPLSVLLASAGYLPIRAPAPPKITDLVAIYQGGVQRPAWTPDQFAPYVSFRDPASGRSSWLFDGFLFVEFQDGRGHTFVPAADGAPATQADWSWLLDRNFEEGHGIPALEAACADAERRLGAPKRRRRVVITLPTPMPVQAGWGTLDGRVVDLTRPEDRIAACLAQVDGAIERFKALDPKHLELAGFYWDDEAASDESGIVSEVARRIRERGSSLIWIPYWGRVPAGERWKELGFDAAWQQPNYFFHPDLPATRLDEACAFARAHGMGVVLELDGRVYSAPAVFGPRLDTTFEAFSRMKVGTTASIAYYEGGGAFATLAASTDPEAHARYLRLARFVRDRQKRAGARP